MGAKNSSNRQEEDEYDDNCNIPVMGEGFDPIYDAALVGDWTKMIHLCKTSVIVDETETSEKDHDNDSMTEDDMNNNDTRHQVLNVKEENEKSGEKEDELGISVLSSSRREWIKSLDYFDGGHDYGGIDLDISQNDDKNDSCITDNDDDDQKREDHQQQYSSPTDVKSSSLTGGIEEGHDGVEEEETDKPTQRTLFIDAKGNTPLHIACRRDPPLSAITALLILHAPSVWRKTDDGCIPLHLACHCGCEVEVANELLNAMKKTYNVDNEKKEMTNSQQHLNGHHHNTGDTMEEDAYDDPLLPRDNRGRTPLHLACSSSRDACRRPDLVRLLLLRSKHPKTAVLTKDWICGDKRMGLELALGDLTVIIGGLLNDDKESEENVGDEDQASIATNNDDNKSLVIDESQSIKSQRSFDLSTRSIRSITSTINGDSTTVATASKPQEQKVKGTLSGRTPLDLIEDDYREELDEAVKPGFSISKAIAACRASGNDASGNDEIIDEAMTSTPKKSNRDESVVSDEYATFYECWAILSLLLLAAGTKNDRVKEALGGSPITGTDEESSGENNKDTKPITEVIQDFQAIHKACQTLEDQFCPVPVQFKELTKKFLAGEVDKRNIGKVKDLTCKWELKSGFSDSTDNILA